jgi:hypothetical protein
MSRRVHASRSKVVKQINWVAAARLLSAGISPHVFGDRSGELLQHPRWKLRAYARHRRPRCRRPATGRAADTRWLSGGLRRDLRGGARCGARSTLLVNDLSRRPKRSGGRAMHRRTSRASEAHLDTHDQLDRAARQASAIPGLRRRCADRYSLFHGGSGIAINGVLAALTPTLTRHLAHTLRGNGQESPGSATGSAQVRSPGEQALSLCAVSWSGCSHS